ncbi:MAG: CinA family protein [Bacteroidales bacterium]|nr:CinA family protein [Bacteroidales bacterium]
MDLGLRLISKQINEILWRTGRTLSIAESCTAGYVATVVTATPGSSGFFRGGLVCYAEDTKIDLLDVDPNTIIEQTPACEEVAKQMVVGANKLFRSNYAVAVTGFAGPGGGNETLRAGTIWLAVGNQDKTITRKLTEDNGRSHNISEATRNVLEMLRDLLIETEPNATILPTEQGE